MDIVTFIASKSVGGYVFHAAFLISYAHIEDGCIVVVVDGIHVYEKRNDGCEEDAQH